MPAILIGIMVRDMALESDISILRYHWAVPSGGTARFVWEQRQTVNLPSPAYAASRLR